MKKRAIFIVLALVLAMALLPVPASAAGGVEINSKNFPDSSFRHYVWLEFDNDCDFYLSASEIAAAKYIYVEDYGITTLKGIEHFSALEDLYCQGNKLTKLDISQNKKLKFLFCLSRSIIMLIL